jgi:hypothetical protein
VSRDEAIRRRDLAIDRVLQHADEDWLGWAYDALTYVAKRRAELTTDAVWYMLDWWCIDYPPEPRALGPVMLGAAKDDWLSNTGRTSRSVRPCSHHRPLTVWASRLYVARLPVAV